VGCGTSPAGAAAAGCGASVGGAVVVPAVGLAPVAAVGSDGVGLAGVLALPPQEARIGSTIATRMVIALIRKRARGIFTVSLLVEGRMYICSIRFYCTRDRADAEMRPH